jgi:hypothetical protein
VSPYLVSIRLVGMKTAQTWTKQRVIEALQSSAAWHGRVPRYRDWVGPPTGDEPDRPSKTTVLKRFGSWNRALEAAGLRPGKRQEWSRSEAVDAIEHWSETEGRTPRPIEWKKRAKPHEPERPTEVTIRRIFGSWESALRAAGLSAPQRSWSRTEILDAVRDLVDETGKSPSRRSFERAAAASDSHPTILALEKAFGSWNVALEAAGLRLLRRDWNRDEILVALSEFARREGRPPRFSEWSERLRPDERRPTAEAVRAHFGSWRGALLAAGLEAPPAGIAPESWTRKKVIAALVAFAEKAGRTPKGLEWRNAGTDPRHPNVATVERIFGSWSAAVTAAGLTAPGPRWSDQEILDHLKASAAREGQLPTSTAWRRPRSEGDPSRPSHSLILKRFGSWQGALNAAGLSSQA